MLRLRSLDDAPASAARTVRGLPRLAGGLSAQLERGLDIGLTICYGAAP